MVQSHANKTSGNSAQTTKDRSNSSANSPAIASPQSGQQTDRLQWMQQNAGNQAVVQLMARSRSSAPIQRQGSGSTVVQSPLPPTPTTGATSTATTQLPTTGATSTATTQLPTTGATSTATTQSPTPAATGTATTQSPTPTSTSTATTQSPTTGATSTATTQSPTTGATSTSPTQSPTPGATSTSPTQSPTPVVPPAVPPRPVGLGLMRQKVIESRTAGTFGQAGAFEAEGTKTDNIGDTSEITTTGVGGQSDVYSKASDGLKTQIKKGTEAGQDVSAQKEEKAKIDRENQKLGVASGLLELGSGIVGLVNMKKAISESNSKSKTAGAIYGGVESAQKSFTGVAKVVNNAAKLEGNEDGIGKSEAVAGYAGSVGDALSSIKSAFFMVKNVYTLFKECYSEEGVTKKEVLKASLEALQNGLEAAQSAVKTVKSILEILEAGVGKLTEAIPGISLAISGVKITIKVFNMMQWQASKGKMTKIKADFKEKYANSASGMVKKNNYSIFGKTIHESKGTDKTKIDDRKLVLQNVLTNALSTPDQKKAAQDELNDIESYELAKEMKNINQKRMTRAGIEAGLEMANIAGDIATLSGAGAAVGISLKAAASGAKTGMSLFRRVKQYGRDKAAAPNASSAWGSVFDAEKSSDKKHNKRSKDADLILDMVSKLPERTDTDDEKGQYQRVLNFIEATGCSTKALFRVNGDIVKQRELLMDSMKQRD
ncbi:hypothetical protein ACX1C1_23330 [Paenibacillus sp. strain BS8-2]